MVLPPKDPDLPFLAAFWVHTARTLIARVQDFDRRLYASARGEIEPLTVADGWQRDADTHFAFLSLAHVVKVCDMLPALPAFPDADVLVLLRNFAEHWDEPTGRSGRALKDREFDPWAVGNLFMGELQYLRSNPPSAVLVWLADVECAAHSIKPGDLEPLPRTSELLE